MIRTRLTGNSYLWIIIACDGCPYEIHRDIDILMEPYGDAVRMSLEEIELLTRLEQQNGHGWLVRDDQLFCPRCRTYQEVAA